MLDCNLKIVAFGDSLTAPTYTRELESLVRNEGGVPNAAVVRKGYPGAITYDLEELFKVDVLQERPQAVVILGGTNDLGYAALDFLGSDDVISALNERYPEESRTLKKLYELANIGIEKIKSGIVDSLEPEVITNFFRDRVQHTFEHLVSMYQRAQEQGISPIAVAVPSVNLTDFSRALVVPPRVELNKLNKGYCAEHGIPYVDLFTATADPETGLMLLQYSMDGLHFNEEGDKLMAKVVFEQGVKPAMQKLIQV